MSDPTYDEISEKARKLWQERGQPTGQDDDIWFQAEHELRGRPALPLKPVRAATANTEDESATCENGRERNRSTNSSASRGMARATQGRS